MQREGRRERRRRETRSALIDAAMRLIRDHGIYGAHVEDITRRADVAKGVFYNYFASKEALIAELVSQGVEILSARYLTQPGHGAVAARVEQLVRAHEAFFREHAEYSLLFHQARGLLELGGDETAELRSAFVNYLSRLAAAVREALAGEAPSKAQLLDIAAVIAGAASGYRSFCLAAALPVRADTIGGVIGGGVLRVRAGQMEATRQRAGSSGTPPASPSKKASKQASKKASKPSKQPKPPAKQNRRPS